MSSKQLIRSGFGLAKVGRGAVYRVTQSEMHRPVAYLGYIFTDTGVIYLTKYNIQHFASSEVSAQLVKPSHSCSTLMQEFPREQ